jgi:hypothetical protein
VLTALIAAHGELREAFHLVIDEKEAAETADVVGIAGCEYLLKNGEDQIAEWIDDHFYRLAGFAKTVARISTSVGRDALTALERERDAAGERLTEAFAKTNAAHRLWHQASAAEEAALMAIRA